MLQRTYTSDFPISCGLRIHLENGCWCRCLKSEKKRKLGEFRRRIRKDKKREKRTGLVLAVAILIVIVSASGLFIHRMLTVSPQKQETSSPSELKAAIVDQLSLTVPNQTFIQTATNILEEAGYTVDYYPGEEITVEFYRRLPTHGYDLVILRVHSSATNPDLTEGPVTLFTSESYDRTKYRYWQLTDQLVKVAFSQDDMEKGIAFFGVNPPFVVQSMTGNFKDAVVIMMGCEGLDNPLMAEAFVQKGAKVYISWDKPVLASHTDSATSRLLEHFLIEKLTLKESLQEIFKEVGFDPVNRSLLIYYPSEVGDQTVDDIIGEN